MEDLFVEMMARTVIAKVQAEHVAAEAEQMAAERQHVDRIGAAFPTVQQDRQVARRRSSRRGLAGVMTEQAHAVAAIDDLGVAQREHLLARAAQTSGRRKLRLGTMDWKCALSEPAAGGVNGGESE